MKNPKKKYRRIKAYTDTLGGGLVCAKMEKMDGLGGVCFIPLQAKGSGQPGKRIRHTAATDPGRKKKTTPVISAAFLGMDFIPWKTVNIL